MKNLLIVFLLLIALCANGQIKLMLPVKYNFGSRISVFSPNGKFIITASEEDDGILRIWDFKSKRILYELGEGSGKFVNESIFSPDSKFLLVSSLEDNNLRIFDLTTAKVIRTLEGHKGALISMFYFAEGNMILTSAIDGIRIFNAHNAELLQFFPKEINSNFDTEIYKSISPDGNTLLLSYDNFTALFDTKSGKELMEIEGDGSEIYAASFSMDGKMIGIAYDDGNTVVYETSSGKKKFILDCLGATVFSIEFSVDNRYILTNCSDDIARIFDSSTGKLFRAITGFENGVKNAKFSPDAKYILSDNAFTRVRLFDVSNGLLVHEIEGHSDYISHLTFDSSGKYFMTSSGHDGTVRIYEMSSGKEICILNSLRYYVCSATFNPVVNMELVAFGSNFPQISFSNLFETSNGKELQTLPGRDGEQFSPDGSLVATLDNENERICVYDVIAGNLKIAIKPEEWNFSYNPCVFSNNGALLVMIESSSYIRIFDIDIGNEMYKFEFPSQIYSLEFSPDDKFLLVSGIKSAKIINIKTGREVELNKDKKEYLFSSNFSPDGKCVVVSYDSSAVISKVKSGRKLKYLKGHSDVVYSVKYSPDYKYIVTSGADKLSRIYDAKKGTLLHVLPGIFMSFNKKGNKILLSERDSTMKIYNAKNFKLLSTLSGCYGYLNSAKFSPNEKNIISASNDEVVLWDANTGRKLYTRIKLKNNNWLVYDEDYRFDGSQGAIDLLYFTCGLEIVELEKARNALYVPNLVQKIMKGENLENLPKLKDLKICKE